MKISVSSLIDSDKKYVEDRINDMKGRNYVWWEGGFFSMTDLKNIRKAEKIVMQRSVDTMNAVSFKIFQIVDEGALASFGVRGSYGMEYDLEKIFFLLAKIDNVVADTECLKGKLFWASTYKYINKKNDQRVIDCYALSFSEAVFRVRAKMGLFDETSQGFEAFVKSTPCEGDKKEIAPSSPETTSVIKMCSSGTGFFVTTNGYLVTNHHVIDGGKLCKVLTEKGIFEARIVKTDSVTDLALLKVDVLTSPCKFSTRRTEKLGTEIFTMGFPMPKYQGFSPKVTKGIISGVEGYKGDVREYQIDASIQPGNSGGPLFDVYGHVVGVLVASLRNGQLVNYAIKKSYIMAFLDNIEDCSFSLEEGEEGELNPLSEVVSSVQNSCALIMTYK